MNPISQPGRERIAACLIVQNEQERLPAALASVAFCDEIVVVDGGSSDMTVEIARSAGARVIENPWPGFAAQRNVALDAACSEWILEIDADEQVSAPLRASIEGLLAASSPGAVIAVCPLRNHFLGRPLGPSAKYPAYRARIFRRGAYRHDETRRVHEGIEPQERPIVLEGDLEHQLAATLREAIGDAWHYAQLESSHLSRPSTPRAYLIGIVLRPAAKLAYRTIIEGGWRDGWRGLLKISLDVTSDALVWALAFMRGTQDGAAPESDATRDAAGRHFGRRPVGPVKVVAIASRERSAQAASQWLTGLRESGVDVALISTSPSATGKERNHEKTGAENVPLQAVKRLRPLAVTRALEIEMQLRTIDAVVPIGRRARVVRRLVPRTLRPAIAGLDVSLDSTRATELVRTAIARR